MSRVRLLAALPLVLLLAWTAWLGADVIRAREHTSASWIAARVDAVDAWKADRHERIELAPSVDGHPRIWFVGSSSIAAPNRSNFTDPFVAAMERRDRDVVVDNLGWEGMPTWDERTRLSDAWEAADVADIRPDLVVFYAEHNDVTYTFHAALDLPHFDAITGVAWVLSGEAFREHDDGGTYWFYGHRRAGPLLERLQDLGLVTPDPAATAPLVERATRVFVENMTAMIESCTARGVPVVLVTPIGNYEARPYGPNPSTRDVWAAALAETDPVRRTRALLQARDAEAYTPDMRMKTPLLDALRGLAAPASQPAATVSVCDVEADWITRGIPFGGDRFLDPVHFSPKGYADLTESIATCLVAGPLAPPVVP